MSKYNIQNKIICCITDNAAINACKWRHLGCFAHSLNLLVLKRLKEISDKLGKVKNIGEFFKRSSHALSKLRETKKQMDLPDLKLKQDVVTRWNSTYDMLDRIYKINHAVVSTLAVLQTETPTNLSPDECHQKDNQSY